MTMHELTVLAQHTSELYHEFNSLDRFEQDYQQKVEEVEALNLPRRGESLKILHSELKQQRKLVKTLKKKSLWSRNLEEIVEKLVDIVTYTHQAISEAFGNNGLVYSANQRKDPPRLGVAGLALHYANVINQIDNIVILTQIFPSLCCLHYTFFQSLVYSIHKKNSAVGIPTDLPSSKYEGHIIQWVAKQCQDSFTIPFAGS
jgi:hypothetical protein